MFSFCFDGEFLAFALKDYGPYPTYTSADVSLLERNWFNLLVAPMKFKLYVGSDDGSGWVGREISTGAKSRNTACIIR